MDEYSPRQWPELDEKPSTQSGPDEGSPTRYSPRRLVLLGTLVTACAVTAGTLSWIAGEHFAQSILIGLATVGGAFAFFERLLP